MASVWVLLMVWASGSSNGGIAVVQQEFTSQERCEDARQILAKAHNAAPYNPMLRAQGCFKK